MAEPRFLTLTDVAEILNTSSSQVYALVRTGTLPAIKIGGRGQWRVERSVLEAYIARMYDETEAYLADNPFTGVGNRAGEPEDQAHPSSLSRDAGGTQSQRRGPPG